MSPVVRVQVLAVALAAAACSSSSKPVQTTPGSGSATGSGGSGSMDWHETIAAKPASQAPFVTPGERMTFNASIHGIDIASFGIAVGDVTDVAGKKAVVVQAGVMSSRVVSLFAKIDDTFTTWIDVDTGRPVAFKGHEMAGLDDQTIEDTEVDFTTSGTGKVEVALDRKDTGHSVEVQENTTADLLDFQSFFLVLRGWDAPVGATVTSDVLRSRYMWRTQLTVGGYENVVTQLGSLPAVRFDGVSRRLSRKGEIDMSQGDRHYSIWVSDDADRVPLKLVAKTDYGDVLMEITDYQAGQGKRLGTTWGGGGAGAGAAKKP